MSFNFYDRLSADFSGILESGIDYNVIIEVGKTPSNQRFKTHSLILQSRSSYFEIKLKETMLNDDNIKIIYLPEISVKIFEIIIKYIYSGSVSIEKIEASIIFDILLASNKFGIDELIKYFQSYLIENNASWLRLNFSKIHQLSIQENHFKLLQEFCNDIFVKYPNTLFESQDFTTLPEKALISILERDDLQMKESEIWDHNTLHQCIPLIRYFTISSEDVFKKLFPYRQLFEQQLWADILSKNLAPNNPISSTILPSRKTPIDSSVITGEHSLEIASWIDKKNSPYFNENPYKFQLILRGSRDGFECTNFYDNCNGISQTILILKVKNTGEIFGGYNPQAWDKNVESEKKNNDAFIFSLKTEKQVSILSKARTGYFTVCNRNNKVGFCGLYLTGNFNTEKKCYLYDSGFEKRISYLHNSDVCHFSVEEYEVFQVVKKSVG
ncbi:hypothetical protein Glove_187g23 [Diversispora epigaea]|uniref:BTB domain-containing protein n=1 Tax=Diversispora epigaea TaxID=1348612 RepID=A0A397IRP6_9GLOM|nr:hypothetical protein Glove_187g23 [Diversispora epigaea]